VLRDWLATLERQPADRRFAARDTTEHSALTEAVYAYLVQLVLDNLIGLDFIELLANALGDEVTLNWVRDSTPGRAPMQRGDFAEILTGALLIEFDGYEVPIKKLRYRVSADDSLTGGDVLALRADTDGSIIGTCLAETKFRSTPATRAAVDAYEQLEKQARQALPDIYRFVTQRLTEIGHPLGAALLRFLGSGSNDDLAEYRIELVWDLDAWREDVLNELDDLEPSLHPLTVDVVRIEQLVELVEELLTRTGTGLALGIDEY
jgi:hypothetical protein